MNKEFDYNFDEFKNLNNTQEIPSSRKASSQATVDIFQEFGELDDLKPEIKETEPIQDETLPEKPKFTLTPEVVEELNVPNMDSTQKIDNLEDEGLEDAINQVEEEINTNEKPKQKTLKKEPTTMEAAFVNCSILGFITLFMGFGWLFYLLHEIAI